MVRPFCAWRLVAFSQRFAGVADWSAGCGLALSTGCRLAFGSAVLLVQDLVLSTFKSVRLAPIVALRFPRVSVRAQILSASFCGVHALDTSDRVIDECAQALSDCKCIVARRAAGVADTFSVSAGADLPTFWHRRGEREAQRAGMHCAVRSAIFCGMQQLR